MRLWLSSLTFQLRLRLLCLSPSIHCPHALTSSPVSRHVVPPSPPTGFQPLCSCATSQPPTPMPTSPTPVNGGADVLATCKMSLTRMCWAMPLPGRCQTNHPGAMHNRPCILSISIASAAQPEFDRLTPKTTQPLAICALAFLAFACGGVEVRPPPTTYLGGGGRLVRGLRVNGHPPANAAHLPADPRMLSSEQLFFI
jgi:hypothetical protein